MPLLRKQDLSLVRCSACGMVHADPLPSECSPDHYDSLGRPYYLSPDKLEGDYASVRFDREIRLFRRFVSSGSVLDVGCSTGAFLHQLDVRFGSSCPGTGIDVSRAALDYARGRGVRVVDDSLLTHDFGDSRFQAITFWAVLEHLPDPGAFLRRARDLLAPGGFVFVLVPNFRSLVVRVSGARYRYILPQHVNYFDPASLARLLVKNGFSIADQGGSHFNPIVLWQDWRRADDDPVADADRAALLRTTTRLKQSPWWWPVHRMVSGIESLLAVSGLADNLWAVARHDGDAPHGGGGAGG